MGNNKGIVVKILKSEICDFAHFEERRFEKSFGERFIFIKKTYLKKYHPELVVIISEYDSVEFPISLPEVLRKSFISLEELKNIASHQSFNDLLKELFLKSEGFDQVNIVFDHIVNFTFYNSKTINFILRLSLDDTEKRNSFQVRNKIYKLVLNNTEIIDSDLVKEIVINFPKPNNLISDDSKIEYNNIIAAIIKLTESRIDWKNHRRIDKYSSSFKSFRYSQLDLGEEEMRKWDTEDPSWRVANDLD